MTTQEITKAPATVDDAPESTRSVRTFVPNVDIVEQGEELLVVADMPGAKAEDININCEQGVLSIHGRVDARQDPENTHYLLNEYQVGDFHRSFRLGERIDTDKIDAQLHNGVLKVRLPKTSAAKPRTIAVKAQ